MTEKSVSVIQPLRLVLLTAFGINEYLPVNDHRLSGPGWLNDVWVEINATIPPGKTLKQVPDMFRRLLIERFGLVAHTETRMVDGYQLMVGPSGIKMKEVEAVNDLDKSFDGQFTASGKPKPDTLRGSPEGATRTISIERGVRRITSRTMYDQTQSSARTTIIDAARMTMAELEPIIAFNLDKPVVDRTGLAGVYQFKIELPPDAAPLRIFGIPGTPQPTGVSTFKALEGLGLKLERQPTPVEVIVVDKIDRTPTAN
jgi:uncharacterized protein (TIGR03435 family)